MSFCALLVTCTSLLHLRQLGPTDPLTTKWASLVRFISYLWQVRTDAARLIRTPARCRRRRPSPWLSVRGDRDPDDAAWRAALPHTFSANALFTTLARLPSLARL